VKGLQGGIAHEIPSPPRTAVASLGLVQAQPTNQTSALANEVEVNLGATPIDNTTALMLSEYDGLVDKTFNRYIALQPVINGPILLCDGLNSYFAQEQVYCAYASICLCGGYTAPTRLCRMRWTVQFDPSGTWRTNLTHFFKTFI